MRSTITHWLFVAAMATLALFAAPPSAVAQVGCTTVEPPCPDDPPSVTITPSGGTYTSAGLQVTVDWADDRGLDAGSRRITLNGSDVTGAFSWSTYSSTARSVGTVTLASGGNTLTASIRDNAGQQGSASASYTYNPPPPPEPYAVPQVSLAPHHSGFRDVARGSATAFYGTPAHVSVDQARNVGLFYSSAQAAPRGLVQVDAYDNSSNAPSKMSIRLRHLDGSGVTFTDGSQEIFYSAASGGNRLAAQFDASGLVPRAWSFDVIVRTWWGDGTTREAPAVRVRVPIVNERDSRFGVGWSLAGAQRLYDQGDGVYITGGDGTGVWFARSGSLYVRPEGEFSEVTFDGTYFHRRYPDGTDVAFHADGRISHGVDRFGNRQNYNYYTGTCGYCAVGELASITDPIGQGISFGYTGGKVTDIQTHGRFSIPERDAAGNLVGIRDPDGSYAFRGSYDGAHRLKTRTDRRGSTGGYAYDTFGTVSADTLPVIKIGGSDTRPVVRTLSWEAALLPEPGTGSSTSPATRRIPENVRAEVTDPRGHTTRLALDRYGLPTRVEAPLGHTTVILRNVHGLPDRVTQPTGASTSYAWTPHGQVRSITQSETEQSVRIEYGRSDYPALPTRVSRGDADVYYTYGTRGELLWSRVGSDTTRYGDYNRGRPGTITDPEGHRTTYAFQTGGFHNTASVTSTDANGSSRTTSFGYDGFGRDTVVTDPLGKSARTAYDVLGRPTRTTDPRGGATTYSYSGDFLYRVSDAAGKLFQFNHNALGWLDSEVDPQGRTLQYRYDAGGNLSGTTNRRGQAVSFTHDALGRTSSRTADGATTTYAYDNPAGLWVAAGNGESTDTIRFDARGRTTAEVSVMGGQRFELKSSYLKEGPRSKVELLSPWARSVSYSYDASLRLQSLGDPAGGTTTIAHDDDGLPTRITLPSGLQQSFGYTPGHLPSQIRWSGGLDGALGALYGYDKADRVLSRSNVSGDRTRDLRYDARGQLTEYADSMEMQGEMICPDPYDLSSCYMETYWEPMGGAAYGYDAVGNRTDSGATLEPSSNRYATFGGYTLVHDADGNVTRKHTATWDQQYQWNSLGQLSAVYTTGVGWITYGYNGFGERVRRTDPNGSVYRYLYDGDDLVMELDGAGNPIREFTHYPGVDRPHSMRQWAGGAGGTMYYYATEPPGQVSALLRASGGLANELNRPGFSGELVSWVPPPTDPLLPPCRAPPPAGSAPAHRHPPHRRHP